MAQQYVTDAGTLITPTAVAKITVATSNSGLSTNGVLLLVGEADQGPDFSLEENLEDNSFGPDQIAAIQAKYGSGPLVDAAKAAAAPANDPNIVGAPARLVLVKTNASGKAQATLANLASGTYGFLADKNYGKRGNLTYFTVDQTVAETLPTTGAFTYLPPIASTDIEIRANGGAALDLSLTGGETPAAFVSQVNALAGVAATGGVDRAILTVAGNLSMSIVSGTQVLISYTGTFAATPVAGDTLTIPSGSILAGGGSQNVGSYVVLSATSNSISAKKLMDASGTPGTNTTPVAVSSAAVTATTEVKAWSPVTITLESGSAIDGVGKSLEIAELTTNTDRLSNLCYALSATKVSWVSKSGSPKLLTSATESRVTLNANRQTDNISESLAAGGEVALKIGYLGTSASVVISDSTLTVTVAGGAGTSQTVDLKDFPTISDVATLLNSKPGFKATVGTAILGQLPAAALDNATTTAATTWGEQPARLKIDAYRFFTKVTGESALVTLLDSTGAVAQAGSGLPAATTALSYLAGGTKGATTQARFQAAIDALEAVRGNFLVPLFSRDASLDVAEKLTDAGSDYTLAAIHASARTHVLKMSTLKRRKNRQAFLSVKDTFANAKTTAANIASFRASMAFQDIRNTASDGTIAQFQPWMGAVVAAAMQAAGFYRAIVHKVPNISGALQAAKDFSDQDDTAMEDALLSGLLPLRKADTGGFFWVSDQTTYGKDSNFVFNSIQATYVADTIALTTAQRMETAFVGQSVADVNAAIALAFLETIMGDFLRLKLIAPSDDAPRGFKNAVIKISGTSMIVSLEVKLAGAIYFIPISFLVSQVSQTAGA